MRGLLPVLLATVTLTAQAVPPQSGAHGRLFPPEDLGILESPDRDEWQQPEQVMDALGIAEGSTVADVGAGGGWFTVRLARRVGPNGRVFAQDIQPQMIEAIKRRVEREGLTNVETRLGSAENPRLPDNLRAVLIVDTYPQVTDPVALLKQVARALAPNGRLGIVDFKRDGAGGPGPPMAERLDPESIKRDAAQAGLKLRPQDNFLRYQYMLVFGK